RAIRRVRVDLAEARFCDGGGTRRFPRAVLEGIRRIPDERAGRLDVGHHLGGDVLHRLEGADRTSELVPDLRVLDGHLERACGPAETVGGDEEGTQVDQPGEERRALTLAPDERIALDRDVTQLD